MAYFTSLNAMSKRSNAHVHLTYKRGGGTIVRQPETITGYDAAMRLIEEIAARYAEKGCRVVKYSVGIRIYDCKNEALSDQSFEAHRCEDVACGLTPDEGEYGRWAKADRQKYLAALKERGLLP